MAPEILDAVLRNALVKSGGRPMFFIWQGGEPTLAGQAFYRQAFKLQRKYSDEGLVRNALQTNGLLLDAEWADLLAENEVLVGLSLDGPEEAHNTYRRTLDGQGTWSRVLKAGRILRKRGVMVNALCCVTRFSENHAQDLYNFFKEEGFGHVQCIPVWETDSKGKIFDYSATPEGYGRFLIELFSAWKADSDGERLSIRLFDSIATMLTGQSAPECGLMRTCGAYLAVEHEGSVYPCDFFVHSSHKLGNVTDVDLSALLNSDRQRLFGSAKAKTPEACSRCQWQPLCNGGCLKFRAFCTGKNGGKAAAPEYVYCSSMRTFFEHALPNFGSPM